MVKGLSKKVFMFLGNPSFKKEGNVIKFDESVEVDDKKYEKLYEFLRSQYKSWVGGDEFEDDDGNRVMVYYTKVSSNGKTSYFIKKIEIESEVEG